MKEAAPLGDRPLPKVTHWSPWLVNLSGYTGSRIIMLAPLEVKLNPGLRV
jgi:hypothetical protein